MNVFVTGATGYLGSRLCALLLEKGHNVKALVRSESVQKAAVGCQIVKGNALDASMYTESLKDCDTLVHLVGVEHPSPKKKEQFVSIDLVSAQQAAQAASAAGIKHIVYVSVAQTPTKVMMDYQMARFNAENAFRHTEIPLTILRPWYVIGPGHYWPLLFLPFYKLAELFPSTREQAKNLKLVYLGQVLKTLVKAVEHTAEKIRYVEIEEMRKVK